MMMVQGVYDLNGVEEDISIGMKMHQKKHVKRNKKEYKRLTEHIGLLPIIIASPNDSVIISGGSEERRRLMDVVISQYDPEYMTALTAYNKALQQRNAMLKAEDEPDTGVISIYEEMMAEEGERIYQKRQAFIEEFIPIFQHFYSLISKGNETVSLNYKSHCQRGALLDIIQRDRQKDRIMGFSLALAAKPLPYFCSMTFSTSSMPSAWNRLSTLWQAMLSDKYSSPTPTANTLTRFSNVHREITRFSMWKEETWRIEGLELRV